MKVIMACFILGSLFGLIPPSLPALQNQSPQYSAQEFETLKNRVSELEKQLQTVENVEKMELQAKLAEANAKLADANAKLANTEFEKFKRELRIDNEEQMRSWSHWLFGILSFVVLAIGAAIWFSLKSLIADRVEKNLNGFTDSLNELKILKNQHSVLERQHAVTTLEGFIRRYLLDENVHPNQLKELREEVLLDVFQEEGRIQIIRYKAAEVLAARKSQRLASPLLQFLNAVVDSDSDINFGEHSSTHSSAPFVNLLGEIHTDETCEGLRGFLTRLYSGNQKQRDIFLTWTALSLAKVSVKLNRVGLAPLLRKSIPDLQVSTNEHMESQLESLATYLDIFNEPDGIKELLTTHGQSLRSHVVDKCLELLQKRDPEFVVKWRAQNATDNAESS